MENNNEFVVMDPVLTSEYDDCCDMISYLDNRQVNILIDNNEKISTDWFDYIFNLKTPDSKCRKKFIENLLIDNEELIDDYDKVVYCFSASFIFKNVDIRFIEINALSIEVMNRGNRYKGPLIESNISIDVIKFAMSSTTPLVYV